MKNFCCYCHFFILPLEDDNPMLGAFITHTPTHRSNHNHYQQVVAIQMPLGSGQLTLIAKRSKSFMSEGGRTGG